MTIVVGTSTPTGNLSHNRGRQWRRHSANHDGDAHRNRAAQLHDLSLAGIAQYRARQSGNSTITTAISGGFNSAISLSASGLPSGTTVSFNPQTIPAPGSGNSTMTIAVGASTPTGNLSHHSDRNGGGIQQNATVTLDGYGAAELHYFGLAILAYGS